MIMDESSLPPISTRQLEVTEVQFAFAELSMEVCLIIMLQILKWVLKALLFWTAFS